MVRPLRAPACFVTSLLCAALAGCLHSPGNAPVASTDGDRPINAAMAPTGSKARSHPGYLAAGQAPNALAWLPPPPAPGSAAMAADEAAWLASRSLQGSARWQFAARDADESFPKATGIFSCAVGVPMSTQAMPRLAALLARLMSDVSQSTRPAKLAYQRTRPFVVHSAPTCTPQDEAGLSTNGSYPSGHGAVGWAWALVLAQLRPARQDLILARGRALGQSRVVCGVHWQSDVAAGEVVGAAVVARLQADAGFQADLAAARRELAQAQALEGAMPEAASAACAAEAAALSGQPNVSLSDAAPAA